jgi:hypothetical protein
MTAKKTQTKVAKKSITKNYSGDEVKRYLGSLSEDFQHKVSAIGEQFGGLNKKIDQINVKLDEHGRKLDLHSEMIGRLMEDMTIVKSDGQEIKTDMKQKVDLEQFARLERRVLAIESRECGGKSKK